MDTKEILGYAAGSIGSAVLAVIILPLLSWYFPADDIGRIVLMQTAAGLTVSVLCLGLDQAYVREYYAAADKDTLFKTLFLPPLLSAAAIAALLLSRPSLPSEILFSLDDAAAGIGLVLFELSFLPIRFLLLVLRMEGRALAFSSAQLVPKLAILLLLLLTVGLLHFPANTAVLTAVYALANLAAAAFLLFQNRCRLKAVRHAPFSPAVLHRGLRYGIPIALSSIAYWGLASADRLFLKKYAGLEQLGVYSMGISFGGAALLFQSIFSTVWTPYIFRAIEENAPPARLSATAESAAALLASALCLTGIFSPLASLLLPENYAAVRFIVVSCMLPPLFCTLVEISGIGLNVVRKTRPIALATLGALAANLLLLGLAVPSGGARGAAVACAASFWLFFVFKTESSCRLWQPLKRLPLYMHTLFCLASSAAYTCFGTPANYPLFAGVWAAYLAGCILRHRKDLHKLFHYLKKQGFPL
ncbi:TPA: lipopolysaccharide biosynthesis protein [Neisseria meningitidis]